MASLSGPRSRPRFVPLLAPTQGRICSNRSTTPPRHARRSSRSARRGRATRPREDAARPALPSALLAASTTAWSRCAASGRSPRRAGGEAARASIRNRAASASRTRRGLRPHPPAGSPGPVLVPAGRSSEVEPTGSPRPSRRSRVTPGRRRPGPACARPAVNKVDLPTVGGRRWRWLGGGAWAPPCRLPIRGSTNEVQVRRSRRDTASAGMTAWR